MLIDWPTVIAQFCNFLILVWLLHKLLFKPVLRAVNERNQQIAEELQRAASMKAEAEKEKTLFLEEQKELNQKKEALLQAVREAGEEEKETLCNKAKIEYEEMRKGFQEQLAREETSTFLQRRETIEKQLFTVLNKSLREVANVYLEEAIILAFLNKLEKVEPQEKAALLEETTQSPFCIKTGFILSPQLQKELQSKLELFFNKPLSIQFLNDSSLISGIELLTPGHRLEWSLSSYTSFIRDNL